MEAQNAKYTCCAVAPEFLNETQEKANGGSFCRATIKLTFHVPPVSSY